MWKADLNHNKKQHTEEELHVNMFLVITLALHSCDSTESLVSCFLLYPLQSR